MPHYKQNLQNFSCPKRLQNYSQNPRKPNVWNQKGMVFPNKSIFNISLQIYQTSRRNPKIDPFQIPNTKNGGNNHPGVSNFNGSFRQASIYLVIYHMEKFAVCLNLSQYTKMKSSNWTRFIITNTNNSFPTKNNQRDREKFI